MTMAPSPQFDFSGGALCLDFVNTLGDRPRSTEEKLRHWGDLASFGEQAGVISRSEAAVARDAPERDGRDALGRAIALREHIYGVFSAAAAGRAPARRDLAAINALMGDALAHARIEKQADAFAWGWRDGGSPFDRLQWAILRSAGDLLVSPERADVRECASGVCSWLFIDRSPARRRRWCSMKTCGNRDKARRFYERHHPPS
jgi:predicted RNA-binding Zn ribbon-like protein